MEDHAEKLPKNWIKKHSKSRPDKTYYFNTATGVSSWAVPKGGSDKSVTTPKKDALRSVASHSRKAGKNVAESRLSKLQASLAVKQALKDKQIVADLKAQKTKKQDESRKDNLPKSKVDDKPANESLQSGKRKFDEQKSTDPDSETKSNQVEGVSKSFKIPKKAKEKEGQKNPPETKSMCQRMLTAIARIFPRNKTPKVTTPILPPKAKVPEASKILTTSKASTFAPKTSVSTAVFGVSSQRLKRFRESLTREQEKTDDIDLDVSMEDTTVDEAVEMMDWETIPEEIILKEIKEIRELEPDNTMSSFQPPMAQLFKTESNVVYIVVDTNVFLSHLQFIESFSERKLNKISRVKLIVPYTVLQELDKIKHRRTDELAAAASRVIRFLNERFSKSEKWIQGQNPVLANNNRLIAIDNPDDNILNCCLQLKQETQMVVLLSNDINLRNKALVSAVFACSKSQFEYEADDLYSRFS